MKPEPIELHLLHHPAAIFEKLCCLNPVIDEFGLGWQGLWLPGFIQSCDHHTETFRTVLICTVEIEAKVTEVQPTIALDCQWCIRRCNQVELWCVGDACNAELNGLNGGLGTGPLPGGCADNLDINGELA